MWLAFAAIVAVVLALDLGVFHRKSAVFSPREALGWTALWVVLALGFNAYVWWKLGSDAGEVFLTGYAIEKSLSVDNLFVFYAVFHALGVPREHQHHILMWCILGAIAMRTVMVFAGVSLLSRFTWLALVFGVVLVGTGIKMLMRREEQPDLEKSRTLRLLRRVLPMTSALHGSRMVARVDGAWRATPLLLALLLIEASDALFAIDSIFAIFAITLDPFLVLTSNLFAVLGLRSLYFVLAGAAERCSSTRRRRWGSGRGSARRVRRR
jgi:tellurite resistance protein TerC